MHPRPLLFAVWASLAVFAGVARPAEPVIAEPRTGTLPNGLRYIVAPHISPAKDASVHLVVHCGSLDERDDERGFAHFIEHLAFSGTRNYPPSAIRVLFQRLGSSIGPDINASTTYSHTRYFFNVSGDHPENLREALAVLRDFADGINFSADEIVREAEVVDTEVRLRDTVASRFTNQVLHAHYQGTPILQRDVGGPLGTLRLVAPAQIRAFYERNYQPQRMTVVVAGAIEAEAVVRQLAGLFGNLAAGGEQSRPAIAPPATPGPRTSVLPLKNAGAAVAEFVAIAPRPSDTPEGRRERLVQRLAVTALNERFRAANNSARAHVLTGPDALVQGSVTVTMSVNFWESAVAFGANSIRRAATDGFSEAEIARLMAEEIKEQRVRIAAAPNWSAAQVGSEIAQAVTEGRAWQTPDVRLAELTQLTFEPAELSTAIATLFAPTSLSIVVVAPPNNAPAKASSVLSLYHRANRRALGKAQKSDAITFHYRNLGPAGTVVSQRTVEDLDLTLVSFNNGVGLNVRPSATEPGKFRLRIVFPQGAAHLDKNSAGVPEVASYLLRFATPSRHTDSEIAALFTEHDLSLQLRVAIGTPILDLVGPSESLEFALGWLTAMFSDLRINDGDLILAMGRFRGDLQRIGGSELELAQRESLRVFSGNDPRFATPSAAVLNALPSLGSAWLTRQMLAGPLEIGLIGDVSAEEAITLAAKTVGTLKKRAPAPKPRLPLVGPKKTERQETHTVSGDPAAISRVLWPVSLPETAKTDAALAVAADVLRDRLMLVLRESLGATYVAQTSFERDIAQRDFAFFSMTSTFHPDKVRQLTLGCIQLAGQLAQRGILPEEFARMREPVRVRLAGNLRENSWWLENVLPVAQRRPDVITIVSEYEQAVAELTPADVNAALQMLQPDRAVAIIARPAPAK
jgi:zinc protease